MPSGDDTVHDYVIIGGGAGGLAAADALASRGRSVLVLEQGRPVDTGADFTEASSAWEPALVAGQSRRVGRAWTACALGGGTAFFAGISFRFREIDFRAQRYLSADALPADWPLDYADMRPWYDQVERRVGVARADGADPWEPPSDPAPMPPVTLDDRAERLAAAGTVLGLHPFPTPLAINTRRYGGRMPCRNLTACTEHICPLGAKGDAASRFLDDRPHPNLTVRTRAKAVRLVPDGPNAVASVEWLDLDEHRRHRARGRVFLLAANAIQSAALLMRSAHTGAPEGLGNSSGMLGRGLSFKVSGYVEGQIDSASSRPPAAPGGGPHSTVAFSDYYLDDDCPNGLGGLLYQANPVDVTDSRTLRMHFLAGDQPMSSNSVGLSTRTDPLGLPMVVLRYQTHPWDSERLHVLARRSADIVRTAGGGSPRFRSTDFRLGSRHLHGTCRAGTDPGRSVTDATGRLHDLDNVYVIDGGVIPFSSGVNPVLTIEANAVRVAAGLEASRPRSS